jgi:hypothetical protein
MRVVSGRVGRVPTAALISGFVVPPDAQAQTTVLRAQGEAAMAMNMKMALREHQRHEFAARESDAGAQHDQFQPAAQPDGDHAVGRFRCAGHRQRECPARAEDRRP